MSFDLIKSAVEDNLNPMDFARGFFDGAVSQPLQAIEQLRGRSIDAQSDKNASLAAKAGNLAGFALDFAILSKISGGVVEPLLGEAAETTFGASAKTFVSGGLYGAVLTPSSADKSLLVGRAENGLVSASTFAMMGGVGKALESNILLSGTGLGAKVLRNSIGGGAGGVVGAYSSVYFSDHRAATGAEVLGSAGKYAAFGAAFAAFDHGLSVGGAKIGKIPAVENAYWSGRSALSDGKVELKKTTYATLNKYDMRHPLRRLGDLVYGTDMPELGLRPELTAANNPVKSFDKDLTQYFAKLDKLDATPRGARDREVLKEMTAVRSDFALKLLTLLHGSADSPGILHHSDAELATPELSVERVAKIREALTSSARAEYPNPSPLTQALIDLSLVEVEGRFDNYELDAGGGLALAKERFYNYDEDGLFKRMVMPSELYHEKREYGKPVTWMPFEATENLPNFFHGTMSNSLPSLFAERTLFSSKEMRLRGIEQVSGESAKEQFPRRAVSMTTDFNEAWAYHRHSPASLTNYPVILGISSDVASRAWPAGMLEPGETLIDKLRLGSSLLTDLGLRKPELTHVFVPDSQVAQITQQLARYRVPGVNVVGLDQIPSPQWIEPVPEDGEHTRH